MNALLTAEENPVAVSTAVTGEKKAKAEGDKALNPLEKRVRKAHLEGFEPPTLGSEDRCSDPLSYRCNAPIVTERALVVKPRNPGSSSSILILCTGLSRPYKVHYSLNVC